MHRLIIVTGLSLLYASAYFLGFLNPYFLYFIPSFFDYIVFPSLISVLLLTPLFLFFASSSKISAPLRQRVIFFGAVLLTLIAFKSLFDAAGYPWVSILTLFGAPLQDEAANSFRWARVLLFCMALLTALGLVYLFRKKISQWLRWLSTLGYAFLFLAIYRCVASDFAYQVPVAIQSSVPLPAPVSRRVVWVIFDEMDYELSLGKDAVTAAPQMSNFSNLVRRAVSVSNAYSPGRDTLYSIPALLTGTALSGMAITAQNKFTLVDQQNKSVAFDTAHSLFGRLPHGAESASVLGFYHPYCKIFPALQNCHSTYLGNAGRWFDSLTFFSETVFATIRRFKWTSQSLPEFLLFYFDPMYRISSEAFSRLDGTLKNKNSSLDFIHLNFPHLPNVYMQRLMGRSVADDADAYEKNLLGADMLLGRIMHNIELQAHKQNILLVVSSDHWLRTHSKRPASIPFIVWRVGETNPKVLQGPFSTVHTQDLLLAFLNGKLNSQADIADQLGRTTFSQTWSAPDGYKY